MVVENGGNLDHPNLQHAFGVYVERKDGHLNHGNGEEVATQAGELVFIGSGGRRALMDDETWEAGLKESDETAVNVTLAVLDVPRIHPSNVTDVQDKEEW